MHTFTTGRAALGRGPEQAIEQVRDGLLVPLQFGQERGGLGAEQGAAERTDSQARVVHALLEHGEEDAEAALKEATGLGALVENHANDPRERGAGGIRVPPQG